MPRRLEILAKEGRLPSEIYWCNEKVSLRVRDRLPEMETGRLIKRKRELWVPVGVWPIDGFYDPAFQTIEEHRRKPWTREYDLPNKRQ